MHHVKVQLPDRFDAAIRRALGADEHMPVDDTARLAFVLGLLCAWLDTTGSPEIATALIALNPEPDPIVPVVPIAMRH